MTRARQANFRCTHEEYEAIASAAEDCDLSVSDWLRLIARGAAGMPALGVHLERADEAHSRALGPVVDIVRAVFEDDERDRRAKRKSAKR
jgi:hypothetical protein